MGSVQAELQVLRASASRVLPDLRENQDHRTELSVRGNEVAAASLERRDLPRDHDPSLHLSHQEDCVVDIFASTPLPPSSISSLFRRLQVFIGPETALLSVRRDHPLPLVLLLVLDGPSPVVPRLEHGSWLELVLSSQMLGPILGFGSFQKLNLSSIWFHSFRDLQVLLVAFELVRVVHEG